MTKRGSSYSKRIRQYEDMHGDVRIYMRKTKTRSLMMCAAVCIAAVLMLTGCGGSTELEYPEGVETYTYTDDYGREVELRRDISRIVASGPNAQMILVTIAPDMMVGLAEAPSRAQQPYFPDSYVDLPTLGQFYGKKMSLNLENLMATDTEIIIDVGEIQEEGNEDMDNIQKQTGIAAIYIEASPETYADAYRKLGKILGREEKAEELAKYCEETMARAETVRGRLSDDDVKTVLFGVSSTGLNCNVSGSVQARDIELIGAKNAIQVGEEEVNGRDGGNPIDFETLYKADPDVIILAEGGPYDKLTDEDSQWKELRAVKEGHYYEIPGRPYSWMSAPPSINQVLGARWLMSVVYPELYEGDIYEDAKEFYRIFWDYELSDEEAEEMLKNSAGKTGD